MKKFEDIQSTKELLIYTRLHGVPTDMESICRMQDIIGHESIETLENIAQDNGAQFYFLLFHVWSWEDATAFYNRVSNPIYQKAIQDAQEAQELKKTIEEQGEYIERLESDMTNANITIIKTGNEKDALQATVTAYEQEILRLKAKLYDLYER